MRSMCEQESYGECIGPSYFKDKWREKVKESSLERSGEGGLPVRRENWHHIDWMNTFDTGLAHLLSAHL